MRNRVIIGVLTAVAAGGLAPRANGAEPAGTVLEVQWAATLPDVTGVIAPRDWARYQTDQATKTAKWFDDRYPLWEFVEPGKGPNGGPRLVVTVRGEGQETPSIECELNVEGFGKKPIAVWTGTLYSGRDYEAIKYTPAEALLGQIRGRLETVLNKTDAQLVEGLKKVRVANGWSPIPGEKTGFLPLAWDRVKEYSPSKFKVRYGTDPDSVFSVRGLGAHPRAPNLPSLFRVKCLAAKIDPAVPFAVMLEELTTLSSLGGNAYDEPPQRRTP